MLSENLKREVEELKAQIDAGEYEVIEATALYGRSDPSARTLKRASQTTGELSTKAVKELQKTLKRKPKFPPILNPAIGGKFWTTPARARILYGGRSSSKSWDAACWAIYLAHATRKKFLCVRQLQNKIEESVYTLLKSQIDRLKLSAQFTITNNRITHKHTGSSFIFYGLWRHIDEIKSMEGIDVCWIEEAHNLTDDQWRILEPTLRKQNSEFWVIFNPMIITDFVYQKFVMTEDDEVITKKINYPDNQHLSPTMLTVINKLKETDEEEYRHVYLGEPLNDDESVIIKRSWLIAAIDAHITLGFEPSGKRRAGFDIADAGGDRCALAFAHGSVILNLETWKASEDEMITSCSRAYRTAMQWGVSQLTFDSIGVGAMAGEKLKEIQAINGSESSMRFSKFNAGGSVVKPDNEYAPNIPNKDMFKNAKAQAWWHVADRLRNTYNAIRNHTPIEDDKLISISSETPHLETLINELSTPKKNYDGAGRVKVESKEDLAKRGIRSPDLADAFIMVFAPSTHSPGLLEVLMDPNTPPWRPNLTRRRGAFSTH